MTSIAKLTAAADFVDLGPERRGRHVFTVTSTTQSTVRCGLKAVPGGGARDSWFEIEGETSLDLAPNTAHQVTVRANVPQDAQPGRYQLRLIVYSVERPGEDYSESPDVYVQVPEKKEQEPEPGWKIPWWAYVAAAVVLVAVAGGLAWTFWPSKVGVPPLDGVAKADVQGVLGEDLKAEFVVEKSPPLSEEPNTVIDQDPPPGTEVDKGSTVKVTLAPEKKIAVEPVTGKNIREAREIIKRTGLAVKAVPVPTTGDIQVNVVWVQRPGPRSELWPESEVELFFGKPDITVFPVPFRDLQILHERMTNPNFRPGVTIERSPGVAPQ